MKWFDLVYGIVVYIYYLYFTGENKGVLCKRLSTCNSVGNPLEKLEPYKDSDDFVKREVGFCAQWCLDNLCKYKLKTTHFH